MLIKIIVVAVLLFAVFLWIAARDRKVYRKKMGELFDREWTCFTRDEYSDKIWKNIRFYHEELQKKDKQEEIDDITWNDLDMDQIYGRINHTRTSAGEEYLYHLLRTPCLSGRELEDREAVIRELIAKPEERKELEFFLHEIGKTDRISVYEYLSGVGNLKPVKRWHHVVAALALFISIAGVFVFPDVMVLVAIAVALTNGYHYYKKRAELGSCIALFSFVLAMVKQCMGADEVKAGVKESGKGSEEGSVCGRYMARLKELSGRFHKFGRFSFLVSGGSSMSGNIFDAVFDYVRILFHVDLIKLATMIQEARKYERELLEICEVIGFLDSMVAAASWREGLETCGIPVLQEWKPGKGQYLKIKNGYHPLIDEPVKNDMDAGRSVLFTGSNASGKSTFIKAVAINAILAQTIHTVSAEYYEGNYFRVYSSMALRDNILSHESYFIVEIKSLQRIFSAIKENGAPVLCFIDEILRGTNTVERVAASSSLLEEVSGRNALCFAATHDIELTYLLENCFDNYHFEEVLKQGDILFDYRVKAGRANSRNAIRLLEVTGFDEKIIKRAGERVARFLSDGSFAVTFQ